jgi:ATP synthase protein I
VKAGFRSFSAFRVASMAQNPDELHKLGQRLDEAQKRHAVVAKGPPPSQLGIAGRFSTELVAALLVGGGLGWGIDWLFGHFGHRTQPVFLLVFFVLSAAAGIRNVMRAAQEINAAQSAAAKDEENKGP